jgi:nucleotide-binding universal stress UspA family protein
MTQGIICTVDFSESSKEALRWSIALAKLLGTHLTILYTYRLLNSRDGDAVESRKKIEESAKINFSSFEKEILAGCNVKYEFKIEVGFISNRIKDYAKKNGASLLVMGSKMNSSNKESFDELAESIQVPLVIVPQMGDHAKIPASTGLSDK